MITRGFIILTSAFAAALFVGYALMVVRGDV